MFKFLMLAGAAYLVYRGVKKAISGLFGTPSSDSEVKKGEAKEETVSYKSDEVIDVDYREIESDSEDDEK